MTSKDYRDIAREKLSGKWGNAILVSLVAFYLGGLLVNNNVNINLNLPDREPLQIQSLLVYPFVFLGLVGILNIVQFILCGPTRLGYCTYLLKLHDGLDTDVKDLFSQYNRFSAGFCLYLLEFIYVLLWMLLFIIPGIVKSYSYAMAYYIQCDNPEMGANEAITRSREMMNGHKWQLFCLHFSFFGWILLSVLTCGLLLIMVTPYMNAATAEFYEKLKRDEMIAKGIDPDATEATFEEAPIEEAPAIESATEETN